MPHSQVGVGVVVVDMMAGLGPERVADWSQCLPADTNNSLQHSYQTENLIITFHDLSMTIYAVFHDARKANEDHLHEFITYTKRK